MSDTYITNNGTLDIYNTSNTDGTINGGANQVLYNNGTLTLNGTSSTNKVIIDKSVNNNSNGTIRNFTSKTLMINNNVEIKDSFDTSSGIDNNGTTTINGGVISGKLGIDNKSSLIIDGNSTQITGVNAAISNIAITIRDKSPNTISLLK